MEILADLLGFQDSDRVRAQMRIERVGDLGRAVLLEIDMGDLASGVHAGIGAARAEHFDGAAIEIGGGRFEHALHSRLARQAHPALIGPAMIFDQELVTRHQPNAFG